MEQIFSLRSRNIFTPLLDLVFPRTCFACSVRIPDQDPFLCLTCRNELKPDSGYSCPVCGSFNNFSKEGCSFCSAEDVYFDKCVSVFSYNDVVRKLIHDMKYKEMTKIASYLAQYAIKHINNRNPFAPIDYVCPVPLHKTKERERGYNQAALIASRIARHFNWHYSPELIKREKFTESQAKLSPEKRKLNVGKAFSIDRMSVIKDSNILIIDDVFTTGATVNSISHLLKTENAKTISVLTVARA